MLSELDAPQQLPLKQVDQQLAQKLLHQRLSRKLRDQQVSQKLLDRQVQVRWKLPCHMLCLMCLVSVQTEAVVLAPAQFVFQQARFAADDVGGQAL